MAHQYSLVERQTQFQNNVYNISVCRQDVVSHKRRSREEVGGEGEQVKVDVKKLYDADSIIGWGDYRPMLEAFGNIAIQVDDDFYSGDSRLLYDENGKIGFLIFGWGSCPGCDALQACDTLDEVQELCDELQGNIKWFDNKQQALEWFSTHDWEGNYYWHLDETKEFVKMCVHYLSETPGLLKEGEGE